MAMIKRVLGFVGALVLQYFFVMAVTFFASFAIPGNENMRDTQPYLFVMFVTFTYGLGSFLGGWLAIFFHWLNLKPLLSPRLVGAWAGALLTLTVGLVIPEVMQIEGALHAFIGAVFGFYVVGVADRPVVTPEA